MGNNYIIIFNMFTKIALALLVTIAAAAEHGHHHHTSNKLHGNKVNGKGKHGLGRCEGDCDRNSDCKKGLYCHQRSGHSTIPHCSGKGRKDWDYCAPRKPKRPAGSFGNASFLNSMGAFKSAMAARMRYLRQHMALVRARYVKAHHYFNARNRAAATKRLLLRFNRAYRWEVRRHQKAIRAHKFAFKQMKKALAAKMRARHYHHLTWKRLAAAKKHERSLHGYRHWNGKFNRQRKIVHHEVHKMRVYMIRRDKALRAYRRAHHMRIRAGKIQRHAWALFRRATAVHAHKSRVNRIMAHRRRIAAHRRKVALAKLRHAHNMHRKA